MTSMSDRQPLGPAGKNQFPNLVFIMADDLGYADLGCYGGRAPISPWLDKLAAQGVRFTHAYANSALCSPSRFALMTGRYQYRLRGGAEEPLTGKSRGKSHLGLPADHPTLPSLLQGEGYRTALIGKWHLGFPPECGPTKSGYQEFWGLLGGGVDYFTHCDRGGNHDLYEGDVEIHKQGYLTDLISQRSVEWLEQVSTEQPFMLSVHYTAPHWPWETRDCEGESELIGAALQHTDGGSVDIYQTMIEHMDEGIGRIMQTLDERGLTENTIVVFTSDNGGERFSDSWPLSGQKMDLMEGGIRVPLIVRWPTTIPAGTTSEQVAMTMDWCATMLEVVGVAAPTGQYALDGISLLANLRQPNACAERSVYWRMKYRQQKALRHGHWKYLSVDGYEYLFDLSKDERERANVIHRQPTIFQQLREQYEQWSRSMPEIPADAGVEILYTQKDMPR